MLDSYRAFVLEFLKFSIVPVKEVTGRNSEAADSDRRMGRREKYHQPPKPSLADYGKGG